MCAVTSRVSGSGLGPVSKTHDGILDAHPGKDGHTVPLARTVVHGLVAERGKGHVGKCRIRELRLLEAQHIWLRVTEPLGHPFHPYLQGIDVPSRNTHVLAPFSAALEVKQCRRQPRPRRHRHYLEQLGQTSFRQPGGTRAAGSPRPQAFLEVDLIGRSGFRDGAAPPPCGRRCR